MRTNLDSYIQTAIHGSELYYQYLREHQRGLVENKVERIQQSEKYVILTLRSALKFPDNAQVRIQNQIYTIEQIKPIEYNEKTNQLVFALNRIDRFVLEKQKSRKTRPTWCHVPTPIGAPLSTPAICQAVVWRSKYCRYPFYPRPPRGGRRKLTG